MRSNVLEDDVASILEVTLDDASGRVMVVNPDGPSIARLVEALADHENDPEVVLLAPEASLKDVMDDFLVASRAADLAAAGTLDVRVLEDPPNHSLIVTDDGVTAVVSVGDDVGGLTTEDDDFVETASEHYESMAVDAESFSLRTPPLSEVRTTLEDDIGPDAAADFDSVLASLETARGNGDGLDEVTISLLVAARNGELLYDISKWGEDIGLASKATFSRTKTTLEDMGLIDTEKVPIDVGRPRLRLRIGDERLEDAEVDELATMAQSLLAS